MLAAKLDSELLRYLVANGHDIGDRLPPLAELSAELGVGVSKLREQLEVARALGLVEVKPRTGIRRAKYSFYPAVKASLLSGLGIDSAMFEAYSELRNQVEAGFFCEAVARLTDEDKADLRRLIVQAQQKLNGERVQIPHTEHREFHLAIFRRLDNPFVLGLLEAYWEAYEAVELNLYADYEYLQEVWKYHARMADCIIAKDCQAALVAFEEHTRLLRFRRPTTKQ